MNSASALQNLFSNLFVRIDGFIVNVAVIVKLPLAEANGLSSVTYWALAQQNKGLKSKQKEMFQSVG